MNFNELVKSRQSVREYKQDEIPKEVLEEILQTVRLAPSAVNFQPLKFIVLTQKQAKKEVADIYHLDWIKSAPVIIVACGDHLESWTRDDGKDHCDIDVAIAVDHLTLAATEKGLGTCWVCAFDKEACSQILELPENIEPIALIPMGYPLNDKIRSKKRKSLDEMIVWK